MESIENSERAANEIDVLLPGANGDSTAMISAADAKADECNEAAEAVDDFASPESPFEEADEEVSGLPDNDTVDDPINSEEADLINRKVVTIVDATTTNAVTVGSLPETANINAVNVPGFISGGGVAESESSPPENNNNNNKNIAESASSDFDSLGFGVEEKTQAEGFPISDCNLAIGENFVNGMDEMTMEGGEAAVTVKTDNLSATLPASAGDNEVGTEETNALSVDKSNIDDTSEAAVTKPNESGNATMEEEEETNIADNSKDAQTTIEQENVTNGIPVQNEEDDEPNISDYAETHTQEELEWLSMGLTLGDALRQIVALTDERDSALSICQEKDDSAAQAESLLVEVQTRLESEMNRRAESDSKARKLLETIQTYEARLEAFDKIEDDLEATRANLVTVVSEKSKLELEIAKLREVRDECERKEAVLSNRLNEAKKKEANKSNTAGRLELDNEELRASLEKAKSELETVSKAKAKLESNMEKLKTKAVERVKQAETALKEERELNEERKKKMKVFVETKAEELREAKENAGDMQKELHETRASLSASREREESFQKELENSRIKYREVQRDMERMKRNAEALHNMGNNLEQELEKSASETEEHKKKRISAKHELMTMMRTLEVERGVSEKLRESMKFTFAPKAQSQQQLLSECLRDFEQELDRLSMKLGKSLMPQSQTSVSEPPKSEEVLERSESNGGSEKKARKGRASKADLDTERLIYHLEQETQHVSKGIMALVNSIERMRILLDEDSTFNCMAFFHHLGLAIGTGEARHQRLGGEAHDDRDEHVSITSFEQR